MAVLWLVIPGGVLPYKRLKGMCRWMGSHFHDGVTKFFMFTVSKRCTMFVGEK